MPIGHILSPKAYFKDNLNKFINNETIAADEKLIFFKMHFDEWIDINPSMWYNPMPMSLIAKKKDSKWKLHTTITTTKRRRFIIV